MTLNEFSEAVKLGIPDKIDLSNDATPTIISVVRVGKYLQIATSISSRIAVSFPELEHFLFSDNNFNSDSFIKLPENLRTRILRKNVKSNFFEDLESSSVKAVILVDPDEWIELFLECKRQGINVFWINAHSTKKPVQLAKLLNFPHYFTKKTKDRHSNVFTFAETLESRELIRGLNLGFKINQNVGLVKPEPVTLATKGKSKVHKTFAETNRIVWFAAGVYEKELLPILKCQIELTEAIPNIFLLLLLKDTSNTKTDVEKAIVKTALKNFRLAKYNIFLVDWDKDEIITSLNFSRITLLGGSLHTNRNEIEVFDPILPISYSSSVVVGPYFGQHKGFLHDLIKCNGIKPIEKSTESGMVCSKELFRVIFDSLKSYVLADRIHNAWSMATHSTGFADEIVKTLKGTLDE